MPQTDPIVDRAHLCVRSSSRGELRFEDHLRPLKYVVAPDGRLVAPVMVAMLSAPETVLFVPQCVEGAMELLVTLEPFEEAGEHGALADRWRIYHGEPEDVRWAILDPDAARFEGHVVDGEPLTRPNPLAGVEPKLCRLLNDAPRDALRSLCARHADADVEAPVAVGVDPTGIDVRRRFDVVHVPATEPMTDGATAERVIREMLG